MIRQIQETQRLLLEVPTVGIIMRSQLHSADEEEALGDKTQLAKSAVNVTAVLVTKWNHRRMVRAQKIMWRRRCKMLSANDFSLALAMEEEAQPKYE